MKKEMIKKGIVEEKYIDGEINFANLSGRLMHLQEERNIPKKHIANAIGISVVAYYRYERGERKPTLDILIALANYFNVSIDYIVGRTNNPKINT